MCKKILADCLTAPLWREERVKKVGEGMPRVTVLLEYLPYTLLFSLAEFLFYNSVDEILLGF